MKTVFFAFMALAVICSRVCASAPLTLSAKVIDSGTITEFGVYRAIMIEARLANLTKSDASVTLMSCSWSDSFVVDPAPRFWILGRECKRNAPETANLSPGESFDFVFPVVVRDGKMGNLEKGLRIGFATKPVLGREAVEPPQVIWAAPVLIRDTEEKQIRYRYEKANPPNKAPVPTTTSVTPAADAPVAPAAVAAQLSSEDIRR
jgi:hypothetical protein